MVKILEDNLLERNATQKIYLSKKKINMINKKYVRIVGRASFAVSDLEFVVGLFQGLSGVLSTLTRRVARNF